MYRKTEQEVLKARSTAARFLTTGKDLETMAIIISSLRISLHQTTEDALELAKQKLGIAQSQIEKASLVKTSIDARRREIFLVCSVAVELSDPSREAPLVKKLRSPFITLHQEAPLSISYGETGLQSRPVVVGFGPAGMFAALLLARSGYRPIVLERGAPMEERIGAVEHFWRQGILNTQTNVQFGEGGAGTFSDGKLTTRIHDSRCSFVLKTFVQHGAPEEILYQAKPHIGTDKLRGIVTSIREEIRSLGGEILFHTCLTGFAVSRGKISAVLTNGKQIPAQVVILAPGHSARDTFSMLLGQGVLLEPKPFSVGVRIEHPQAMIDRALYHGFAGHPLLGPASYQLSLRQDGRAVYTFCMCPGGVVVPAASEEQTVVVNGMSEYARDRENANAALVVSVDPSDFGSSPLDGMDFQRQLERRAFQMGTGSYRAPAQGAVNFLEKKPGFSKGHTVPSYALSIQESELHALFPDKINEMLETGLRAFDRKIKGFAGNQAVMTGVETRTSSPIRVTRGEDGQAPGLEGLYPCGEGAGYAGGIMSAAVDGLRQAQAVMERYRPDIREEKPV